MVSIFSLIVQHVFVYWFIYYSFVIEESFKVLYISYLISFHNNRRWFIPHGSDYKQQMHTLLKDAQALAELLGKLETRLKV